MLQRLSRYGAVATKVRAMIGEQLALDDYRRLAAMRSVGEIAAYLRGHSKWSGALDGLPASNITRYDLELALRRHSVSQTMRLLPYIQHGDRAMMRYPVLRVELEQIMRFMRLASIGRAQEYVFNLPAYFDKHSKIKYNTLSVAVSYEDMLNAVRDTDFYPILSKLRQDGGGFPSYVSVELAMNQYYYRTIFNMINRRPHDEVHRRLREAVGIQADLYNIMTVIRIKRYYPHLTPDILNYLIPHGKRLKSPVLKALCSAPDAETAVRLLGTTPYGKYFSRKNYPYIESYSSDIMNEYFRRHIAMDLPSVFSPMGFLFLGDVELQNLIHIIECVRYGVSPERAQEYLVGV